MAKGTKTRGVGAKVGFCGAAVGKGVGSPGLYVGKGDGRKEGKVDG